MTQNPTTAQPDADLLTEISNLRQENVELHELLAVQRAEIATLQRKLRRERLGAMQAAGAVSLLRAVLRAPACGGGA